MFSTLVHLCEICVPKVLKDPTINIDEKVGEKRHSVVTNLDTVLERLFDPVFVTPSSVTYTTLTTQWEMRHKYAQICLREAAPEEKAQK